METKAKKIIAALSSRAGFDDIFGNLDEELTAEIELEINKIIDNDKLYVGDSVKVRDSDYQYPNYEPKCDEMGFTRSSQDEFKKKHFKGVVFKIFAIDRHDDDYVKLFGIESPDGKQFLFGKKGLKKV